MTQREERKQRQRERDAKLADDLIEGRSFYVPHEIKKKVAQGNKKGGGAGCEGETDELAAHSIGLLRLIIPAITAKLSHIYDPRNPDLIIHTAEVLMAYGILIFLCQISSCREANRRLSGEDAHARLLQSFPELKTIPHADTLKRLLSKTNTEEIQNHYESILINFLKSPAFRNMNKGRYILVIDGSGKFSRQYNWDTHALRRHWDESGKETFHAYMLDSILVLNNGITIPLLSEPVSNNPDGDGNDKQDCELRAFHRLAERLVNIIGRGQATLLLDGIYANGPVISKCINYGWDYMIVLKSDSLKTVWDEFYGLCKAEPSNTLSVKHGNRAQVYRWANGIEYTYGNNHQKLMLNLVTCLEKWIEPKPHSGGVPEEMSTCYAWLSSEKLNRGNVFDRCTHIGRLRWWIESNFNTEKHQGYNYSHCFSYNWNAMMGFHYLMKIAHFINALLTHNKNLAGYVHYEGISGFVKKLWETILNRGIVNGIVYPKRRGRPVASGRIDFLLLCPSP